MGLRSELPLGSLLSQCAQEAKTDWQLSVVPETVLELKLLRALLGLQGRTLVLRDWGFGSPWLLLGVALPMLLRLRNSDSLLSGGTL